MYSVMGQWRHKNHIAKKLCLSFYVTDDNLNFQPIAKKPYDIYLDYWITMVSPLLDRGVYSKFVKENDWVGSSLPGRYKYKPIDYEREVQVSKVLDSIRRLLEII